MDVRGLVLVGTFVAVEQVKKSSGDPVPGMYRIRLDCGTADREWIRDASFFDVDKDTGLPSPFAVQAGELALGPGDLVAVKVRARGSSTGTWVNLDALAVVRLPAFESV